MSPSNKPVFLALMSQLNIDPNSTVAQVSCPNRDGTYGGAMGPAQFIPVTWQLYSANISKITGSNPPNPWNNSDAFVATGLYLQNAGAGTKIYSDEKRAAAKYYCGASYQRYACSIYASNVMSSADSFQRDIDTLNANGG